MAFKDGVELLAKDESNTFREFWNAYGSVCSLLWSREKTIEIIESKRIHEKIDDLNALRNSGECAKVVWTPTLAKAVRVHLRKFLDMLLRERRQKNWTSAEKASVLSALDDEEARFDMTIIKTGYTVKLTIRKHVFERKVASWPEERNSVIFGHMFLLWLTPSSLPTLAVQYVNHCVACPCPWQAW